MRHVKEERLNGWHTNTLTDEQSNVGSQCKMHKPPGLRPTCYPEVNPEYI